MNGPKILKTGQQRRSWKPSKEIRTPTSQVKSRQDKNVKPAASTHRKSRNVLVPTDTRKRDQTNVPVTQMSQQDQDGAAARSRRRSRKNTKHETHHDPHTAAYEHVLHESARNLYDRNMEVVPQIYDPEIEALEKRASVAYLKDISAILPKEEHPPEHVDPHEEAYLKTLHESAKALKERTYTPVGHMDYPSADFVQDVLKVDPKQKQHTDYGLLTFTRAFAPDVFDPKLGQISLAGYRGRDPDVLRKVYHESTWMLQTAHMPEFQQGLKIRFFGKPGTVRCPYDYDASIDESPPSPVFDEYHQEYIVEPRVYFFSKPGTVRNPFDFDVGYDLDVKYEEQKQDDMRQKPESTKSTRKSVPERIAEIRKKSIVPSEMTPDPNNPDDYGVHFRSKVSKASNKGGRNVKVEMEETFSELHHKPSRKSSKA